MAAAQIGRNLAGHREQYVRIFAELMGEFDERLLARGRDLAALDPGQIGWGDATSGSNLPQGVSRILLGALLAEFANMVAKGCAVSRRDISLHVAYIDNNCINRNRKFKIGIEVGPGATWAKMCFRSLISWAVRGSS